MTTSESGAKRRTARQSANLYRATEAMQRVEYDLHTHLHAFRQIPFEWEAILMAVTHHKTRITLRVDQDVLKFFRAMGPGYQPRMNEVLRAFMHCRLAGLIDGPEDITGARQEHWAGRKRP